MSISATGAVSEVPAFFFPGGYLFLRVFHQFFGYHTVGIAHLPRAKVLLKLLAVAFLIGLIAEFPLIDGHNNYVGGYWFDHSPFEVEGAEFLATQIPRGSRVVIDARVKVLIYAFAPYGDVVTKNDLSIYRGVFPEETWNECVTQDYQYVFVSTFYETMYISNEANGAKTFSVEELTKFVAPYFIEVFRNDDVAIYQVRRGALS
jgi:hypothetical protein